MARTERILAFLGGTLAALAGLGFGAFRFYNGYLSPEVNSVMYPTGPDVQSQMSAFTNSRLPLSPEFVLGNVAFGLVFTVPFLLALAALRWPQPAHRAAIWTAAAGLARGSQFSTFTGYGVFFLPAVPLLGLAALLAFRRTAWRDWIPALGIAAILVAIGVGAFYGLILHPDGRCWANDGVSGWHEVPYQGSSISGGSYGTMTTAQRCSSDVISLTESLGVAALWALTWIGFAALRRRWPKPPAADLTPLPPHSTPQPAADHPAG